MQTLDACRRFFLARFDLFVGIRLAGCPAEVDRHRHAGDAAASRTEQERYDICDLRRFEQPLHRLPFEEHALEHFVFVEARCARLVRDLPFDERRPHVGGTDCRGADSHFGSFERERLDEAEGAVLCRDIAGLER